MSHRQWMDTACEKHIMLHKGRSFALLLQTVSFEKNYKIRSKEVPHRWCYAKEYTE
jgi:hypothetical protein